MKTINMADAHIESMRGNLDHRSLKRPEKAADVATLPAVEQPPAPQSAEIAASISATMELMAKAVGAGAQQSASLAESVRSAIAERRQPEAATKWRFKITKRDSVGNIVEFTAERE